MSEVTRLFFRSEILADNEVIYHALSEEQGSPTETVNLRTNSETFTFTTSFATEVGDGLDETISPTISVNIPVFDGDPEVRFRLVRSDSVDGAVLDSSSYSSIINSTGINTETLSLTTTWQEGDWLRIDFEVRRASGHGNVEADIATQDSDSYIDVELSDVELSLDGASESTVNVSPEGSGQATEEDEAQGSSEATVNVSPEGDYNK